MDKRQTSNNTRIIREASNNRMPSIGLPLGVSRASSMVESGSYGEVHKPNLQAKNPPQVKLPGVKQNLAAQV